MWLIVQGSNKNIKTNRYSYTLKKALGWVGFSHQKCLLGTGIKIKNKVPSVSLHFLGELPVSEAWIGFRAPAGVQRSSSPRTPTWILFHCTQTPTLVFGTVVNAPQMMAFIVSDHTMLPESKPKQKKRASVSGENWGLNMQALRYTHSRRWRMR